MRTGIVLFVSMFFLSACAQKYTWTKPGATQTDYYRASSYCDALSRGATPMDFSNSGTSTTYHSGSVYGTNGQTVNYTGTSTTYKNNTGQAMANLGQAISRQNLFNNCMRGQGFTPKSENTTGYASRQSAPPELESWNEYPVSVSNATISDEYDQVPLKAKPTNRSSSESILEKNETVDVLSGANGSWVKVLHNNIEGYLAIKWLEPVEGQEWSNQDLSRKSGVDSIVSEREALAEGQEYSVEYTSARITQDQEALRFKPSPEAMTLKILGAGETVEVLKGVSESWIKVRHKLQVGFVSTSSITPILSEHHDAAK